jgi:glycerophosphoryl diester phosphodiesterase
VKKILSLGHRGAAELTENTIPSFEKAIEQGADGIELDVRRTADEQLVVVHPPVVGRHAVQSSTYEQVRKLRKGFEVPLLKDVLVQFGKKAILDIEFKTPGFEAEAIELIHKHGNPAKTIITAFDTGTLTKVHDLSPELELGYIYNRTQDEESRHNAPIDYVIPQFKLASRELISEVHEEELKVLAWTVNEESEMKRLLDLGVDGIITDYPAKLAKVLKARAGDE